MTLCSRYAGVPAVAYRDRTGLALREIPAARGEALMHVVIAGDTLDLLARRYYGDESLYWYIADANPARFALAVQPGDVLAIPALPAPPRGGASR